MSENEQKPNLRGNDGAQYVRQQKGHSIIAAVLLGWVTLYILPIYWAVSKDHYYHL